jgi:hypothetical protein
MTSIVIIPVKNFPESRGIVIGLLKAFVGLSGAIYTQLYLAIHWRSLKEAIRGVGPPLV